MTKFGLTAGLACIIGVVNSSELRTSGGGNMPLLKRQFNLSWGPCYGPPDLFTISCANFTVPLDWTNDQNTQKAFLNVIKLSPTGGTSTGTIFVTPGDGQGALMLETGRRIFDITQGRFDIISWDPRGVGGSEPRINCFDSNPNFSPGEEFAKNLTFLNSLECRSSGPTQSDIDALYAKASRVDAYFKTLVDRCQQKNADNLKYLGIMASVRDLVAIANEVVGANGLIHYWGLSYGTLIGQYLLTLHPQRMGRVVLDGIYDFENQRAVPHKTFSSEIRDAELTLTKFYQACADAGPQRCKLADTGSTADSIRQDINRLIDVAYKSGVKAKSFDGSLSNLRLIVRGTARTPSRWSTDQGIILFEADLNSRRPSTSISKRQEDLIENAYSWEIAHLCGDVTPDVGYTSTKEVQKELVRMTQEQSNIFGPTYASDFKSYCHLWPVRSVERFQGPFNPQPVNPVIVIGVSASVVATFGNAVTLHSKLNSGGLRRAALIRHDGVGETSFHMPSACTEQIIRNYFLDGKIPEDTTCNTNFVAFPNSAKGVDYGYFLSLFALVVGTATMFQ